MNRRRPEAHPISRRQFLVRSTAVTSCAVLPCLIPASARGADGSVAPSERITVGLIGYGAMGRGHLHRFIGDRGTQLLAVSEVDRTRLEVAREAVDAAYAEARRSGRYQGCGAYNDYRELLGRSDLDAVAVVTPDHWHTLQTIHAAKAGKDIYCEKPISVTIQEGRLLAKAVQSHSRVFQTGTQYRSIPTIRQVCQFVRDGGLGQVQKVFTLLNRLSDFIGAPRFQPYAQVMNLEKNGAAYHAMDFPLPAEPVLEGLDWELWVGPAPWKPYNRLYHINPSPGVVPWSFCDAFGVASTTWHLSHSTDVIQYALGVETSGPVEIIHPAEGKFPTLTCRYATGTLLHFVDHWGMVKDLYKAVPATARLAGNFGGVFVGERGWVTSMSTGGPVEGGPEELFAAMNLKTREVRIGENNHHANWLECIRSRKQPSCHEEIGHRSASTGHLAAIASRLGRSLKWDPVREEFAADDEANRLRTRPWRTPWQL